MTFLISSVMRRGKIDTSFALAIFSFLTLLQCSFAARNGPLRKSSQPRLHGFAEKGRFSTADFLHFSHSSEDEILTSAEEQEAGWAGLKADVQQHLISVCANIQT